MVINMLIILFLLAFIDDVWLPPHVDLTLRGRPKLDVERGELCGRCHRSVNSQLNLWEKEIPILWLVSHQMPHKVCFGRAYETLRQTVSLGMIRQCDMMANFELITHAVEESFIFAPAIRPNQLRLTIYTYYLRIEPSCYRFRPSIWQGSYDYIPTKIIHHGDDLIEPTAAFGINVRNQVHAIYLSRTMAKMHSLQIRSLSESHYLQLTCITFPAILNGIFLKCWPIELIHQFHHQFLRSNVRIVIMKQLQK